jgi:hypothetical protein
MAETPKTALGGAPLLDFRELGSSGLNTLAYTVYPEEEERELLGRRGVEQFKAMRRDHTVSTIMTAITTMLRQVSFRVEAASSKSYDTEAADFIETCLYDMEHPWTEFYAGACEDIATYGFSLHEVCLKRRAGKSPMPFLDSHYSDGRIGWRALPGRSADTIERWSFDANGRLLGAVQIAPPHFRIVEIPIEKCLLFRSSMLKNNPSGLSLLRGAWRAWKIKRGIENIEAVGVERDTCGIPIVHLPQELMQIAEGSGEDAAIARKTVESFKTLVCNIRRDSQEGIVFPRAYDESGNLMYEIGLITSAGSRQFDTAKIIERYDTAIARTVAADFLFLGSGAATGSWAMHTDKTKFFLQSIGVILQMFCEVVNRAIKKLVDINGFTVSDYPKLCHSPLEKIDAAAMAQTILALSQAGMPIFPNPELEQSILQATGLPATSEETEAPEDMQPRPAEMTGTPHELHDASTLPVPTVADDNKPDTVPLGGS